MLQMRGDICGKPSGTRERRGEGRVGEDILMKRVMIVDRRYVSW